MSKINKDLLRVERIKFAIERNKIELTKKTQGVIMLITAYLALATTMLALPSPELAKGTGLVIVTLLFTKHTASATKRKNRIEKAIDDAYVEIDRVLKKLS